MTEAELRASFGQKLKDARQHVLDAFELLCEASYDLAEVDPEDLAVDLTNKVAIELDECVRLMNAIDGFNPNNEPDED